MNERLCDNDECPFVFRMHCIQPWFCIIGVGQCPTHRRTRKTPDELYGDLLEKEENDEDNNKDEK